MTGANISIHVSHQQQAEMPYDLSGVQQPLRVAVPLDPPFIFPCAGKELTLMPKEPQCRLPGLDAQIIGSILDEIGVSYTLLNAADIPWGSEPNPKHGQELNASEFTGLKKMLNEVKVCMESFEEMRNAGRNRSDIRLFPLFVS